MNIYNITKSKMMFQDLQNNANRTLMFLFCSPPYAGIAPFNLKLRMSEFPRTRGDSL